MELHGLGELAARGDPEPLRVHARRIALEAHAKLGGWRQLAVDELLAFVAGFSERLLSAAVKKAGG